MRGTEDLSRVNAALRRMVTADQRAYARPARRAARQAGRDARGGYETFLHTKLVSASTVVVSVLMPAVHLFPGGTEGGWVLSGTVLVPSGRRVGVTQLFARPAVALPVLAREFKRAFRRQDRSLAGCLSFVGPVLRPTAHNYRNFALLPGGLAVGVAGYGNCERLIATIPYARLRAYFSHSARVLIDGVRRPTVAASSGLRGPPPAVDRHRPPLGGSFARIGAAGSRRETPSCAAQSAGGRAAVHRERRACHKARVVAEKEGHERSYLLGTGNPPGGVGRGERGAIGVEPDAEQFAV